MATNEEMRSIALFPVVSKCHKLAIKISEYIMEEAKAEETDYKTLDN